jgi:hypothetical protein
VQNYILLLFFPTRATSRHHSSCRSKMLISSFSFRSYLPTRPYGPALLDNRRILVFVGVTSWLVNQGMYHIILSRSIPFNNSECQYNNIYLRIHMKESPRSSVCNCNKESEHAITIPTKGEFVGV